MINDEKLADAELAHERVISADLRKDFRALQAQAAARDEEIARLQRHAAILEQHKVAASAHGRELFNRIAQLEALTKKRKKR